MVRVPDFRRSPPFAPQLHPLAIPPEIAAHAPRLDPTMPIARGQLVMSDYTRQQLQTLGWKEGDPVPGDLSARIKEIQSQYDQERETAQHEVPEGWKPVKPELVQIDDLPPERQAELRQYLVEHKNQMANDAAAAQQRATQEAAINPNAPPTVQEAHRVAIAASNQSFAFVNDLPPSGMPPLPVPDGKVLGGVSGLSPALQAINQVKQAQAAPSPKPPPPEKAPSAGAIPEVTHCPRCTWDLRMAFRLEPTPEDKIVYRAALLGGTRFEKELTLFDDQMKIRFRSMTVSEARLMREQLRYDTQAGKILGDGEFIAEMWEYRLVMSISQVRRGADIIDIPPVEKIPYEAPPAGEPPETPLVKMREWFYRDAVPTETMARIVREQHQQFNRLQEYLETMSQEPNFFKGIAPGL